MKCPTFQIKLPKNLPIQTKNKIRDYAHSQFDANTGMWTFASVDLEKLSEDLQPSYPLLANLLLTSPRFEEAREYIESLLDAVENSKATDTSIKIKEPPGCRLRPYQRAGVAFALERESVLIADQPGLGKTPQALSLVYNLGLTTGLIVCPNIAKINWYREARKWLPDQEWIHIVSSDTPTSISEIGKNTITITNYEALIKYKDRLKKNKWDFIICDEAHFIKNEKTQRAKALYEVSKKCKRRIALTGTPLSNGKHIDLWGMLQWLDEKTWSNKWNFQMEYCDPCTDYEVNRAVLYSPTGVVFQGCSNGEKLQTLLRSTLMIRRLKKDVLKDLPNKQRTVFVIPQEKRSIFVQAKNAEEKIKGNIEALLQKAEIAKSPHEFNKIMKNLSDLYENDDSYAQARIKSAQAKMEQVVNLVDSIIEHGEKVIIFAHHREILQKLHEHYGKASRMIIGGMPDKERQKNIDAFQTKDNIKIIVCSYMASGTAITLTASHTVVCAEIMYDPGCMEQAEDRSHRIGQEESVSVYYCVLENSIDARIADLLVKKLENIEVSLDGKGTHDKF